MARCCAPQVSLVAYEAWPKGRVFVRVPGEAGRYVLTDRCVVEVGCPSCKAATGEPCKNPNSGLYWAGTHCNRRVLGTSYRSKTGTQNTRPKSVLRTTDIYADD